MNTPSRDFKKKGLSCCMCKVCNYAAKWENVLRKMWYIHVSTQESKAVLQNTVTGGKLKALCQARENIKNTFQEGPDICAGFIWEG